MSSTIASPPSALQPKSLREEIVELVQRDIIAGHFRPGQRLVERELIQRFGVSSIPIREALQELENRGLVVRRHNCGCSVIQLSRHEAARICELRRVLEPKVMEWAAERVTPEAAAALRSQLAEVEHAAAAGPREGHAAKFNRGHAAELADTASDRRRCRQPRRPRRS